MSDSHTSWISIIWSRIVLEKGESVIIRMPKLSSLCSNYRYEPKECMPPASHKCFHLTLVYLVVIVYMSTQEKQAKSLWRVQFGLLPTIRKVEKHGPFLHALELFYCWLHVAALKRKERHLCERIQTRLFLHNFLISLGLHYAKMHGFLYFFNYEFS